MRLAILGGTFNPPHNGHLFLAKYVLTETDYDAVVLVPTSIPAHKHADGDVTPSQRLKMVELLCEDVRGVMFDSCDIDRGGVSYSIDTVADIVQRFSPSGNPGFIIGDDLLAAFASWKSVDALVLRVELLIAHRVYVAEQPFPYPHRYLGNNRVLVTSHDIRRSVKAGRSIKNLVPAEVDAYIRTQGLYRHSKKRDGA